MQVIADVLLKAARAGKNLRDITPPVLAQMIKDDLGESGESKINVESLIEVATIIKRSIKLKVLILGPGETGGPVYKKRCEVRDLLTRLGHDAHFCEEIWTPEILQRSGLNLALAEYIQALTYDYIVCLMASAGSIGEAHDFAKDKRIAAKMMICIDAKHRDGYSAQGILRIFEGYSGRVDWFQSPADITDCHLATRIIDHVLKISETKQLEILAAGGVS
jgi:hypothetical protein